MKKLSHDIKVLSMKRLAKRAATLYADLRVGATRAEKYAHRSEPSIMLTFDDFGSAAQIKRLLSVLGAAGVQAMIFVQGDWYERQPELVIQLANAGHIIGNHTYSHPDLLKLSDEEIRSQLRQGVTSAWLRPPMGRYNRRIRRLADEAGMKIVYWTIDSDDWRGGSSDEIRTKVLRDVHPGAVILFHLHADNTLAVLPQLISDIRAQGFQLASLPSQENQR